jgi:hypothetical protein
MKKVKIDKYDMKRGMCGSPAIYDIEYKCTRVLIDVITMSITTVKVSNQKPQDASNNSQKNQSAQ